MTPTEAGVRELCANTRENGHLHINISVRKLASADIGISVTHFTYSSGNKTAKTEMLIRGIIKMCDVD